MDEPFPEVEPSPVVAPSPVVEPVETTTQQDEQLDLPFDQEANRE